ncbi:Phage T7 exclusion protein [Halorubrum sp. DM2]|uniref:P-loop NTPase fold protein n=1 Tax=Halorubrum sp. DM2 TaxID=2527867 RepID=UPI0024CC6360|nr:P-loop NTPase fold protein [Halorubrum sp. DM2]VTT86000.1 Phage T7 exclusion protein [Halorubrum sp. DM2]
MSESGGTSRRDEYYGSPDLPTTEDDLGFRSYVNAVMKFLTHDDTEPPLTISVEGDWGSGKSSFLLQLEDALREKDHHTVQFNPWQHDKEEQLWAVFAIQFFDQLTQQLSATQRWKGHIKLYLRRTDWNSSWISIIQNVLLGLLAFIVTIAVPLLVVVLGLELSESLNIIRDSNLADVFKGVVYSGSVLLFLTGITSIWIRIRNELGAGIRRGISQHVNSPDYSNRIPFVESFHDDFENIVNAYSGDKPVFVFIDDLDRCENQKAAELMEGINALVSVETSIFFIVAMDRDKVAASVAKKHQDPVESERNIVDNKTDQQNPDITYGNKYLQKFIQISFQVPSPSKQNVEDFVESLVHTESSQTKSETVDWHKNTEALNNFHDKLTEMSSLLSKRLDYNPRDIKKFVNTYRFQTLLAKERGIIDRNRGVGVGITVEQLGKFVALSLQKPQFVSDLSHRPKDLNYLQEYALDDSDNQDLGEKLSDSTRDWKHDQELISLLNIGCDGLTPDPYSFENANVEFLLQISPESDLTLPDERRVTVRILEPVGEIFGTDERVYKLRKSQMVSLPATNAIPLVERGAAEIPKFDQEQPSDISVNVEDLEESKPNISSGPADEQVRVTIEMIENYPEKIFGIDGQEYRVERNDVLTLPVPDAIPLIQRGFAKRLNS